MPDAFARITELDEAILSEMAAAMELRAADPLQRGFVDSYLATVDLHDARVLEIGCGTGAITRSVARRAVRSVLGIDPSPVLVDHARRLAVGIPNVSFEVGDGRDLPVEPASFDVVVLHTVLCHVPEPETVLAEAARALRAGGAVAVFDGDYATITFAVADGDPLEVCADEFRRAYVHDPWIMRRMSAMVRAAGFVDPRLQSHGYVQTEDLDYMLTVVHRGADALAARGVTSAEHVESLKREARRRVAEGSFFGHIGYISVVATKPA